MDEKKTARFCRECPEVIYQQQPLGQAFCKLLNRIVPDTSVQPTPCRATMQNIVDAVRSFSPPSPAGGCERCRE